LGGQDGGDEQLQRTCEIQLAMRVGVGLMQAGKDALDTRDFDWSSFARHDEGSLPRPDGSASAQAIGKWLNALDLRRSLAQRMAT
jgi:hypothetical protein